MAKAYSAPEGMDFQYDFTNYDPKKYDDAETDYIADLKDWCKHHSDSNNPLVGETISTPRGDGYAIYMVFRTKPLELIHVPIGDAWQADSCWIRGLRLADVKRMVNNKLFA